MLSKFDIYFTSKDLKANFFCFYFLFVSCRLFLKNRSPRSASHLSSIDLLCFCSSQACIIFIVHPSIHPSFHLSPSLHYPTIVLSLVYERRGQAEGGVGGGGGGRKEDGQLSTFLPFCLCDHLFLFCYGLIDSSHPEPKLLK